jgi:hypothetical protein
MRIHKKISLLFSLSLFLLSSVSAQTNTTERVIGGQVGFLGAWFYGELPISSSSVIRTDLGLDGAIRGGSFFDGATLALAPSVTVSPRFYYNLNKRMDRNKNTAKNSANFVSLRTTLQPGWFVLSNKKGTITDSGIIILPTWGIRRIIAQKVSVESGIGIGYTRRWFNGNTRISSWTAGLHLRVGI